jgi:hypothetical protein
VTEGKEGEEPEAFAGTEARERVPAQSDVGGAKELYFQQWMVVI